MPTLYALTPDAAVRLRPATEAEYVAWLAAWFTGRRSLVIDGRTCVVVEE